MADSVGRWSAGQDEAPAELEELLSSARSDLPSASELAHVEQGLGSLLNPPGAAVPTAPPAGLGAAKLAAVALGVGLVAGGVWLASREKTPPPEPRPALESPRATAAAPAPETATPSATPSVGAETTSVEAAPSAAEVAPSPTRTHAKKRTPIAHDKPSEADLLNRARTALKTDPKHALGLTRQHKQLYPNGVLSQEREVIAIEALSRLNEKNAAEERADRFEKQYPDSAHQEKVRSTVDED